MGVVDLVCALVHGYELERSERGKTSAEQSAHGLSMKGCFDGEELLLCDAVEPGMMVLAVTSTMTSLSASLVSLPSSY
jgi:hypothetical protein